MSCKNMEGNKEEVGGLKMQSSGGISDSPFLLCAHSQS